MSDLLSLIRRIKTDPPIVITLYEKMSDEMFWVFYQSSETFDVFTAKFLIYPVGEGTYVMPFFSTEQAPLFQEICQSPDFKRVKVQGRALFNHFRTKFEQDTSVKLALNPGLPESICIDYPIISAILHLDRQQEQ